MLLHLLALLPVAGARPGDGAGRGRRPARRRARLQGVRRPVGQGRLVRRRTPGRRGRPQRLLAGAQRRLRPGRLDPPRAAGHHRHPRAGLRGHRRRVRPPPQGAAGRAARARRLRRGGRRRARARRRRPDGPRRVARRRRTSPGSPRGWPDEHRQRLTTCGRHRAGPRQDQPAPRGRALREPTASTRSTTVYQAVGLYDDVTAARLRRRGASTLRCADYIDARQTSRSTASNIVDRAADLLAAHHGLARLADVQIVKAIPVAGGLAGGSADAAAALVALDRLWDARHHRRRPARAGRPARQRRPVRAGRRHRARHRPRRARRRPSRTTAPGGGWSCPSGEGLSTPRSTATSTRCSPTRPPTRRRPDALLAALASGDPPRSRRALHNDLQAAAFDLRPDLEVLIERGEAAGALRGLVSGSGPDLRLPVRVRRPGPRRGRRRCSLGRPGASRRPRRQRPRRRRTRRGVCLMANLLNLERVSKSYGVRPLLTEVSLGIAVGERIGIVGRNGDGKTTLLEVMTGLEEPDSGRVSHDPRPARRLPPPGRRARRHPQRARGRARRPRRPRVGRRLQDARGRRGAARRRRPRPPGARALRWRASSVLAGRAAAGRPRPDRARRADQPPRRRGGRLARRAPGEAALRDGRRDPRPVVPR